MSRSRAHLLITTAFAAALVALPAHAQTAPQAPTADEATPRSGNSEEIVVTAQKRSQALVDVPLSISVVGGEALEQQHANNFQDYLKLVPGLQLTQDTPGFGRLVMRGINTGGVAATVGVYVDDTPFGSSSGLANGAILAGDFDTFDVSRVEVIRGPQGTLYGASSMGGILKFVTNAPETDKFEARARAGVEAVDGGDPSYYGNAVVNVPLGSTLAFRASGTYRHDGGFIDSIGLTAHDLFGNSFTTDKDENINSSDTYGGRASLLFTPNSDLSVRLSAIVQNIDADAPSQVDADPKTLEPLYGGLTQSQFVPSTSSVRYRVYNGLLNWNLGFGTLTSSTSYSTLTQKFNTDATFNLSGYLSIVLGTPNELYLRQTTQAKKFTQELRLASNPNDTFEWLVGGFYTHEDGLIDQAYVPVTPGTMNEITTLPLLAQVSLNSKYEEIAGFANGTLHLGSMFDVDFGGRYSHNDQSADQMQDGALVGGAATYPTATSSEDVFTWSVAPKVKLGTRQSIYARVARGFRPGGPNVLPPSAPANTPSSYKSDTLTSYEIGFKSESADHRFAFDIAAFHIDWNRIQLYAVVNNFGINVNGTNAKSDGVEFTASFRPVSGFNLSFNGAYTHARLEGDTDPVLVGGVKGDRLPFTPEFSMGVNSDYRWTLGGDTQAFVGGSVRIMSEQSGAFSADYKAAYGRQPEVEAYQVFDLQAGLDFGKFTVEAYVKNLGNSHAVTSTSGLTANGLPVQPNGAMSTGILRPRTIGVSLTAGF